MMCPAMMTAPWVEKGVAYPGVLSQLTSFAQSVMPSSGPGIHTAPSLAGPCGITAICTPLGWLPEANGTEMAAGVAAARGGSAAVTVTAPAAGRGVRREGEPVDVGRVGWTVAAGEVAGGLTGATVVVGVDLGRPAGVVGAPALVGAPPRAVFAVARVAVAKVRRLVAAVWLTVVGWVVAVGLGGAENVASFGPTWVVGCGWGQSHRVAPTPTIITAAMMAIR